jgi:hypothetical protein
VRTAVRNVVALGRLPAENSATVDRVRQFERALRSIEPPLTDAEAEALVPLFGPDNCFGLSWTLVYLIESAPSWPIEACLRGQSGWEQCLREPGNRMRVGVRALCQPPNKQLDRDTASPARGERVISLCARVAHHTSARGR